MSGEPKRPIVCWDSCVWIAWFNQEEDKADYMERMKFALEDIKGKRVTLLLSAVNMVEVLNHKANRKAGDDFREFVNRENAIRASVDFRVAKLASAIRERTIRDDGAKGVKPADSMIAATAIIYGARELLTFDNALLQSGGTAHLDQLPTSKPRDLAGQWELYGGKSGSNKPLSLHGADPDDATRRATNPPFTGTVKRPERESGQGLDRPTNGRSKK